MFAGGTAKRRRPARAAAHEVFRCSGCGAPLALERVLAADGERRGHAVTGYVVFRHSCPCTPVGVRSSRSWSTHAAFCALFGSQPWLPYRAPFRYRPVADDDPLVERWAWELDQVSDVGEFLLFLGEAHEGHQT